MPQSKKPYYLWDTNLSESQFKNILNGKKINSLDQKWALLRLLEYAAYQDIIKMLGYKKLIEFIPQLINKIRSESRRRGYEFLLDYIPKHHPDWI